MIKPSLHIGIFFLTLVGNTYDVRADSLTLSSCFFFLVLSCSGPPLVFLWLGSLPQWAHYTLAFAATFSKCKVYLLCSSKYINSIPPNITFVDLDSFDISSIKFSSLPNSNPTYWKYCLERFHYLLFFAKAFKIPSLFHAELDNIIFSLEGLSSRLDKCGKGIFVPRDHCTRAIASLIYINSIPGLSALVDYISISNDKHFVNDMEVLGDLAQRNDYIISLPTESILKTPTIQSLSPNICAGLFDAASLGQYLFGIDPRNSPFPIYNRYINEFAGQSLTQSKFRLDLMHGRAEVVYDNELYNLYNIHVHSKCFSMISHLAWTQHLIYNLNKSRRTLISLNLVNLIRFLLRPRLFISYLLSRIYP